MSDRDVSQVYGGGFCFVDLIFLFIKYFCCHFLFSFLVEFLLLLLDLFSFFVLMLLRLAWMDGTLCVCCEGRARGFFPE